MKPVKRPHYAPQPSTKDTTSKKKEPEKKKNKGIGSKLKWQKFKSKRSYETDKPQKNKSLEDSDEEKLQGERNMTIYLEVRIHREIRSCRRQKENETSRKHLSSKYIRSK